MENKQERSKEPWLAIALSSLIIGIGQIYSGRTLRGIILITTYIILNSIYIWTILNAQCDILISASIFFVLTIIYIWNLFDAYKCAIEKNQFICFKASIITPLRHLKSKDIILIIIIGILLTFPLNYSRYFIKTYIVEAFRIPTNNMSPTLIANDYLLVRKSVKYIPKRGDVVAFIPPIEPNPHIQRIAALPGDIIEIKNGTIYIQGEKTTYFAIKETEQLYADQMLSESKPYIVPQKHFFLLGDNSVRSCDSRFYGAVSRDNIIGRAYKIYWPLSRRGPIE